METREMEGGRKDAEGGSIPAPLQGQVLLLGVLRRPLPCQIYSAAEPHSVLAPALMTGRKPEPRGEGWGKRQCPC